MTGARPRVVAHRGNSSVAPQNTLAAFEAAWHAGADALLNEAIEQIVIEGVDPATAFESVTPRIETAYTENVEPYL